MQMKNNPKKFSLKESVSCHLKLYIKKKKTKCFWNVKDFSKLAAAATIFFFFFDPKMFKVVDDFFEPWMNGFDF